MRRERKTIASMDFAAIEARILARFGIDLKADMKPTDPDERAKWKHRNYLKLYGVKGKIGDLK